MGSANPCQKCLLEQFLDALNWIPTQRRNGDPWGETTRVTRTCPSTSTWAWRTARRGRPRSASGTKLSPSADFPADRRARPSRRSTRKWLWTDAAGRLDTGVWTTQLRVGQTRKIVVHTAWNWVVWKRTTETDFLPKDRNRFRSKANILTETEWFGWNYSVFGVSGGPKSCRNRKKSRTYRITETETIFGQVSAVHRFSTLIWVPLRSTNFRCH